MVDLFTIGIGGAPFDFTICSQKIYISRLQKNLQKINSLFTKQKSFGIEKVHNLFTICGRKIHKVHNLFKIAPPPTHLGAFTQNLQKSYILFTISGVCPKCKFFVNSANFIFCSLLVHVWFTIAKGARPVHNLFIFILYMQKAQQ